MGDGYEGGHFAWREGDCQSANGVVGCTWILKIFNNRHKGSEGVQESRRPDIRRSRAFRCAAGGHALSVTESAISNFGLVAVWRPTVVMLISHLWQPSWFRIHLFRGAI